MLDIRNIEVITNNDSVLIHQLLNDFINTTYEDLFQLNHAAADSNTAYFITQAHRIRGAALMIGANRLTPFLQKIENDVHQMSASERQKLLLRLHNAFHLTVKRIKQTQNKAL